MFFWNMKAIPYTTVSNFEINWIKAEQTEKWKEHSTRSTWVCSFENQTPDWCSAGSFTEHYTLNTGFICSSEEKRSCWPFGRVSKTLTSDIGKQKEHFIVMLKTTIQLTISNFASTCQLILTLPCTNTLIKL